MKGLSLMLCLCLAATALGDELVVMLLDTSGSMRGQEEAMVRGVNDVLANMSDTLGLAKHWSGTFNVQIYLFSGHERNELPLGHERNEVPIKRLLLESPLHLRPQITLEQYQCNGGTPLYDVLGDTLATLPPNSTLVVATDGEDTTSRRFRNAQIVEMLNTTLAERDIHIIYVYKGVQAEREAMGVGIGNCASSGTGTIAIGLSSSDLGAAFTTTFANFGGSAATFRHIVVGEEAKD